MRSVLEEQIKHRTQSIILSPTKTMDDTLGQEYAKGEVAAMQLAVQMPEVMLSEVNRELEQAEKEMKNAT